MNTDRYSTGTGVTGGSALIHEFYSREVANPIHLTVDTGFKNGEGTIKAYISVNLSLGDRQLAAQFQEVPLDLRMVEAERLGCMNLINSHVLLSLFNCQSCTLYLTDTSAYHFFIEINGFTKFWVWHYYVASLKQL